MNRWNVPAVLLTLALTACGGSDRHTEAPTNTDNTEAPNNSTSPDMPNGTGGMGSGTQSSPSDTSGMPGGGPSSGLAPRSSGERAALSAARASLTRTAQR